METTGRDILDPPVEPGDDGFCLSDAKDIEQAENAIISCPNSEGTAGKPLGSAGV
jgi:hypothetical protein